MRTQRWMRQGHRWLSLIFTLTVIANFVAMAIAPKTTPPWVTYSPLPPLLLMLLSGLYLFFLPWCAKSR